MGTTTKTGRDIGITEGPFADAPVISEYTDDQAVDDGTLVALGRTNNRITRALFDWLTKVSEKWDGPPSRWPINFMAYIGGDKALALCKALIHTQEAEARRIYEHNVDGGIWQRWYVPDRHALVQDEPTTESTKLWMLPNECGGMTLMFPSDY